MLDDIEDLYVDELHLAHCSLQLNDFWPMSTEIANKETCKRVIAQTEPVSAGLEDWRPEGKDLQWPNLNRHIFGSKKAPEKGSVLGPVGNLLYASVPRRPARSKVRKSTAM